MSDEVLASAQASGLVQEQGEQLTSAVALQSGQWTLSGRPFAGPLGMGH